MKSADKPGNPAFSSFNAVKRKVIRLSQSSLVRTGALDGQGAFPLVVEPNIEGFNAETWAETNREFIETELLRHGAILFRGFNLESARQFDGFARAVSPDLLEYQERAAPQGQR